MIYLMNEVFKVIGKSKKLSPNKDKGEFVLHKSIGKSALKEVANANDIEVGKKDSAEVLMGKITENFVTKEIPVMSEKEPKKTELEVKCEAIVKAGMEAGKEDDVIQVELVGAGLKFKQAASAFKKISEALGFRITAKDRQEKIEAILEGYIPESWDDVTNAAKNLSEKVDDTTEAQAIACLRKVCKNAEKEFPKKPKGAASGPRGFKKKAHEWIVANKKATKDDLKKFLEENEQRPVYLNHYWEIMELCRAYSS